MSNQQADMRQHEQEMREAFEKWFKDYSDAYDIEVGSRNYYAVMKAWNAATLAAEARIRELEGEWVMVPVKVTRKIEDAIARSRNLKCSEIWENAIDATLTEHKENQG